MLALNLTGVNDPVLWLDAGLHNHPDRLRAKLQEEIDRIGNVAVIILAFGFCGLALLGIKARQARLVIPRADDCISLLLGSTERREALAEEAGTYFLSRGWMEHKNSIWHEYNYCSRKYGSEKATAMLRAVLAHYHRLAYIRTGDRPVGAYLKKAEEFAARLGLQHLVVEGSPAYFQKLLLGPWDHHFLVLEAGEEVTLEHILAPGEKGKETCTQGQKGL